MDTEIGLVGDIHDFLFHFFKPSPMTAMSKVTVKKVESGHLGRLQRQSFQDIAKVR